MISTNPELEINLRLIAEQREGSVIQVLGRLEGMVDITRGVTDLSLVDDEVHATFEHNKLLLPDNASVSALLGHCATLLERAKAFHSASHTTID